MSKCIFKLKLFIVLILFSVSVFSQKPPKLSLFANFLYWHASEEITSSWAYIPQLPNITAPNIYFNWSPGVRTGLDYFFKNEFDTKFYWTYFSTKTQASATAGEGQILLPEFFNGFTTITPFTSGNINWQLHMNMFDFEIGHSSEWSKRFTTRPFIGVKGGSINQKINSNWEYQGDVLSISPVSYLASENLYNNFSGVGPSFGIDNTWHIYNHFNLRGDFSGAFLWGTWKIQDVYTGPSLSGLQLATTITSNISNSLGSLMLRYFAGFDWTYEAKALVTVKLGYEMQFWMNQLRIPVFQQVPVHGDLTLQGGTCGILIKF